MVSNLVIITTKCLCIPKKQEHFGVPRRIIELAIPLMQKVSQDQCVHLITDNMGYTLQLGKNPHSEL